MINIKLFGATGKGTGLEVTPENAIKVELQDHPPLMPNTVPIPYREFFTNNGSNDMRVNGSVNNQLFSIESQPSRDKYIKTIKVLISDAGARLDLFGAITALTNGLSLEVFNNAEGSNIISEGIKTNLDLIRAGTDIPSTGDGISAFRADISGAGADSYLVTIDFEKLYGLKWGIRLNKIEESRISWIVKDDITGIDILNAIGYGVLI